MQYNKIIDGRAHANELLESLKHRIHKLSQLYNVVPKLAVILVGNDPASMLYVKNKIKQGHAVGIMADIIAIDNNVTQEELALEVTKLNADNTIHGIIVQMPLPKHINTIDIISLIDRKKDVDGFHPINIGLMNLSYGDYFIPCTPQGCVYLLKKYIPNLSGIHVCVIGRSQIVGKPLSILLLQENCTVTICHSYTKDLHNVTSQADIVISAIGKPRFLTSHHFKQGAIVIDVGINRIDARFVGDVDLDSALHKLSLITPVPGGVGPMTVAYLLHNTVIAAERMIANANLMQKCVTENARMNVSKF